MYFIIQTSFTYTHTFIIDTLKKQNLMTKNSELINIRKSKNTDILHIA